MWLCKFNQNSFLCLVFVENICKVVFYEIEAYMYVFVIFYFMFDHDSWYLEYLHCWQSTVFFSLAQQ